MAKSELFFNLNNEQKKAVDSVSGNLLILASAGTGKTTTIVERYVNMVENHKFHPKEIMMTTFTNKAAKDMIEKIKNRTKKLPLHIGTMHSLFLKILRSKSGSININPNFTLLTEEREKKKIIKEILNELPKEKQIESSSQNINYLLKRIEKFKNRGVSSDELVENLDVSEDFDYEYGNDNNGEITEEIDGGEFVDVSLEVKNISNYVYKKYQEKLKEMNKMDFDDILLYTYLLLEKNPNIRKIYQKKFKSIMVDEAQDLNVVQRNILELLQNDNLCLIGDDCQNIYSWRGASNELIFNFDKEHRKIVLKDNYRSSKEIIGNVNNIIDSIDFKIDKKLNSTREGGKKIEVKEFYDFDEELSFIVSDLKELIKKKEHPENISVLFRTNRIGKKIERLLRKEGIPCHLSRAKGFFEREEIRDALSFIKLKVNNKSLLDFERVLGLISGIGKSKISQLKNISFYRNVPIVNSLNYLEEINMPSELKEKLKKLNNILRDENKNPLDAFLDFFNYKQMLEEKYYSEDEKVQDKIENLDVLKEILDSYNSFKKEDVRKFLDGLIELEKNEKDSNRIILSTIHSAKGLEWKYVYLIGCNEKILPFYKWSLDKNKKDDELRLFYVAVSRAKDFLKITFSSMDSYRELEPSRFLDVLSGDFQRDEIEQYVNYI